MRAVRGSGQRGEPPGGRRARSRGMDGAVQPRPPRAAPAASAPAGKRRTVKTENRKKRAPSKHETALCGFLCKQRETHCEPPGPTCVWPTRRCPPWAHLAFPHLGPATASSPSCFAFWTHFQSHHLNIIHRQPFHPYILQFPCFPLGILDSWRQFLLLVGKKKKKVNICGPIVNTLSIIFTTAVPHSKQGAG